MDKEFKITDRQIAHLREEISIIHRQAVLISVGSKQTNDGKCRLDVIKAVAEEIDKFLCDI